MRIALFFLLAVFAAVVQAGQRCSMTSNYPVLKLRSFRNGIATVSCVLDPGSTSFDDGDQLEFEFKKPPHFKVKDVEFGRKFGNDDKMLFDKDGDFTCKNLSMKVDKDNKMMYPFQRYNKIKLTFKIFVPFGRTFSLWQLNSFQFFRFGNYCSSEFSACDTCGPNRTALTFNIGESTEQYQNEKLLDLLKKYGIKSTFFVTKYSEDQEMEDLKCRLVARYIREGHYVGCLGSFNQDNYKYDDKFKKDDNYVGKYEVQECKDWVRKCSKVGFEVTQFRPYGGDIDRKQAQNLGKLQKSTLVFWTFDVTNFAKYNNPTDPTVWDNFVYQVESRAYKHNVTCSFPPIPICPPNPDPILIQNLQNCYTPTYFCPPLGFIIMVSDLDIFFDNDPRDGEDFISQLKYFFSSTYRFVTTDDCWKTCRKQNGFCADKLEPYGIFDSWKREIGQGSQGGW